MKQTPRSHEKDLALICIRSTSLSPDHMRFAETVIRAMSLRPVLFHVTAKGAAPDESHRILETAGAMLTFEDIQMRRAAGNVEKMILRELERDPYHLLVLGTSIRTVGQSASPLSQRLANKSRVSALLIRNPPKIIEKILICTGGHTESQNVVSLGVHLAQAIDAKATILHVVTSAPAMYTGLDALEEGLESVLTRDSPLSNHLKEAAIKAEDAGVKAKLELRHGVVSEEIIRACEVEQSDLVVTGSHRPGALMDQLLLGRITPQLVSSSNCSTLIVRG
jgi:nucleotide-binding universal stress UspA family protein